MKFLLNKITQRSNNSFLNLTDFEQPDPKLRGGMTKQSEGHAQIFKKKRLTKPPKILVF